MDVGENNLVQRAPVKLILLLSSVARIGPEAREEYCTGTDTL